VHPLVGRVLLIGGALVGLYLVDRWIVAHTHPLLGGITFVVAGVIYWQTRR
jgi:hypothetical protein